MDNLFDFELPVKSLDHIIGPCDLQSGSCFSWPGSVSARSMFRNENQSIVMSLFLFSAEIAFWDASQIKFDLDEPLSY